LIVCGNFIAFLLPNIGKDEAACKKFYGDYDNCDTISLGITIYISTDYSSLSPYFSS
jgi:hypothetical protein